MLVASGVAAALAAAAAGRWGNADPGTAGEIVGRCCRHCCTKPKPDRLTQAPSQLPAPGATLLTATPPPTDLLRAGLAGQAATGLGLFIGYLSIVPPITWLAVGCQRGTSKLAGQGCAKFRK